MTLTYEQALAQGVVNPQARWKTVGEMMAEAREQRFCVVYRTGGYASWHWARTIVTDEGSARQRLDEVRRLGYHGFLCDNRGIAASVRERGDGGCLPVTFDVDEALYGKVN